jgi:hypothetical protein
MVKPTLPSVKKTKECLGHVTRIRVVIGIEAAVAVCCCSTELVVKQRLKCNTDKMCNCLIQFLLTTVLSIEERVFLVEYAFRKDNSYTDLVQEQFAEKLPETSLPHRNGFRRLVEKFRETSSLLDARVHHFQQLL